MKKEHRFYEIYPSVVKSGALTYITISPIHHTAAFEKEYYSIKIIPKEKREFKRNPEYKIHLNKFRELEGKVNDGRIVFEYEFFSEQEYAIVIEELNLDFRVYALDEDLFGTMPFKGDLHIHTTGSDGIYDAREVPSFYREAGYDFICITDHHKYEPSLNAVKTYEKVDTGLKIFPGEEVHNESMGYIHIVNFNGGYSVNELLEKDFEAWKKEIAVLSESMDIPEGCDKFDFAMRKWICNEIRKSGGKAILPHPYWTVYGEYHMETEMITATLKSGMYDIYELLGGCECEENQLQMLIFNQLCREGLDIPVVGSSDAHDHIAQDKYFKSIYTIVFAKSEDEIIDAIMSGNSVAVESYENQNPRAFGGFRLSKYALFLLREFYPIYCQHTKDLGALMRSYAKNGDCIRGVEELSGIINDFKNRYFGLD